MREALLVSRRLREGESTRQIAASLRMPKRAAERFVLAVERTDPERLRRALAALADLEVDLRGGGQVTSSKRPAASLSERTLAVAAIVRIAPP
jgi:DNA polymerase III delta subunit